MKEAFSWQTAAAASAGFDAARLDALCAGLAARATKAFLVARGDRIVYEWYAPGHGPGLPHTTASLAKALSPGAPTSASAMPSSAFPATASGWTRSIIPAYAATCWP